VKWLINLAFAAALAALPWLVQLPAEKLAAPSAITSAKDQLSHIREDMKRAHAANDAAAYLASANKMSELLNASPASLLQLASAQAFAGDDRAALDSLEAYVRMGQSNEDVLELAQFDRLRKDPRYPAIHARMLANTTAISRASIAFRLADPGLIPEDIDYEPATKLFYITSVLEKKILSVDASGSARAFATAPDQWPMMALKVDRQRHILWATEAALSEFDASPQQDWGRSAILIYDLRTRRLLHRIVLRDIGDPPKSALGDMALTADGDAIVSDGEGGGVYRVRHDTLVFERLDAGEFISPQTPAISADGKSVFVPDYLRGIGILNLDTRHVAWIPMDGMHALSGIDGLYLNGRTLIATQNGTSPERVVEFGLDASLTRVESETIIERATPTLGDPTHGVVVGEYFYYIANSGWDTLDDHGHRKPDAKPSVPLIMKAKLHH
jgi:hypothetical protein